MTENITVISGMFYVGQGTKMDMAKMKGYGPGTFLMVPANTAHFAMTKTPTVLELSGDAPLKDVMIK